MWRSRFAWILTLGVALAFAASASATVSVSLGASCGVDFFGNPISTCPPGSVVQVTARVTADGGELDNAVFGAINVPIGQATGIATSLSQVNLSTVGTAAPGWSSGSLLCTTAFCTAFSQVNSNGPTTAGVTNLAIGSMSFQISPSLAQGTVMRFNWRTTPSTQRLEWYGLTNAPGTTITVAVPEPSAAALLALGLAGLALAARRHP